MQSATTQPITAWEAEAVARFAAGDTDILVLPRHDFASLGEIGQTGRVQEYWSMVRRDTIDRELRFGLNELQVRSPDLAADVAGLVTSFLDQFNLQQAKLRVEITRSQSCPKFHCDNVNVRLVTTYFGPTTEYQYAGDEAAHKAPLYGLVFLKGRRHSTHGESVYHRSPKVPSGEKRLCVAIDY